MILEFDRTNLIMPNDLTKMELWMGDLFPERYEPRDTPRPTKLMLQMVLLHKNMDGSRSWFLVIILAFMVKFQQEQGTHNPSFKCMILFTITS